MDDRQLLLEIAFILNAYHGLRLARTFNANVSVELHTDLADDVERSIAYARRYHELSPDRFIVKLPLTPAGLVAVRGLSASGIPVNFTLGFSARQNYLAALFSRPRYVNVFMGRLNAFVSASGVGDGENVGEKTTLATQRYVRKLRTEGRTPSKLIGASIRSGAQVAAVIGTDVLTMPPKAAGQYRDSAPSEVRSRVDDDPEVSTAEGHSVDEFNGESLWAVSDALVKAVNSLLAGDADRVTPDELVSRFAEAGVGDLFPPWSAEDRDTTTDDGKIPVFATWRSRLASKQIGLDALMNLSALCSFATDQKALDDRVRGLI
jgi:transaldolase